MSKENVLSCCQKNIGTPECDDSWKFADEIRFMSSFILSLYIFFVTHISWVNEKHTARKMVLGDMEIYSI